MIIKSWSGKINQNKDSFRNVLYYIEENAEKWLNIKWNLDTEENNIEKVLTEFKNNSKNIKQRKNWNLLYHETISFNGKDKINDEKLTDIARKYLEKRAKNALAYAVIHRNTNHPHIHIVISANQMWSKNKFRLDRNEFARIKQEMESYQRERYPKVEHSKVEHRENVKNKASENINTNKNKSIEVKEKKKEEPVRKSRWEREFERRQWKVGQNRKNNQAEKQIVASILQTCLNESKNEQNLKERLAREGLELYHRGNTPWVQDTSTGKKHRIKTLGLLDTYTQVLKRWEMVTQRNKEIETIQVEKGKIAVKEMWFKEDIKDILKTWREEFKNVSKQTFRMDLRYIEILKLKRKHKREKIIKALQR